MLCVYIIKSHALCTHNGKGKGKGLKFFFKQIYYYLHFCLPLFLSFSLSLFFFLSLSRSLSLFLSLSFFLSPTLSHSLFALHMRSSRFQDVDITSYMATYAEGFIVARSDWEYFFNTFVFGVAIGYHFITTESGSMNGNFLGNGIKVINI